LAAVGLIVMLKLYNSLSGKEEVFQPIDPKNVRMYVCGPTVYDRAHIGNARAVVVYDILYRILRKIYGAEHVKYVRNITDVDDKINNAAIQNKETIKSLTTRVTKWFHDDMSALNNLEPNIEPRATDHISEIIKLIEKIIANGHAYVSENHVLFDVKSFTSSGQQAAGSYHYGQLSGKKLEDLISGARVEVESYKKNPEDFVLWKPSDSNDDISSIFDSPWGKGRPGWHIECSAMSMHHLGAEFDIHGGGADLKFPHHENEIAQAKGANHSHGYAKYWVHNGFLTVNGEKMSKSLGNFITVKSLIDEGVKGEVIRFVLLSTHYRKPLDFNDKALQDAKKNLDKLYEVDGLQFTVNGEEKNTENRQPSTVNQFFDALLNDMNTPLAISHLLTMAKEIKSGKSTDFTGFKDACNLLGILNEDANNWFKETKNSQVDEAFINQKIAERNAAKAAKNFQAADAIRNELQALGVTLKDTKDGTQWSLT
jgi:cysteinyl-tRNA synthetase